MAAADTSSHGMTTTHEHDADSGEDACSLDQNFDSRSMASSVQDYEFSNGRRYHAYRPGSYLVPNDEQEQSRELMMHVLWKRILGGALTKTELINPGRIFDVGTGAGLWAVEMADNYPESTVVGIDLSPIQPNYVPENCHFYVDDFQEEWDGGPYDFVHGRALMGTVRDWPEFYRKAFQNLAPGGMLEMQELDAWIHCQAPGVTPPFIEGWNEGLNVAFTKWGRDLNVARHHAKWIREAGFVDVDDQVFHVPIGTWPRSPHLKEIGRLHMAGAMGAVDSYSLSILTDVMGQTPEETEVQIELIKTEFRQNHHLYGKYHFITGRKPETHDVDDGSNTTNGASELRQKSVL